MNIYLRFLLCIAVSCLPSTFVLANSEKEAEPAPEKESGSRAEEVKSSAKDAQNFKTLDPMVISIIKSGKVYGYLRLEIQISTKDATPIEPFRPLFPILEDAYMSQLYSLIGDRWIPDQPLKQEVILQIIQDLTSKIVKEKSKSDNLIVFLKNFYFAPANKD